MKQLTASFAENSMLMQFQNFDRPYLERLRSGDFTTEQHFFAYFSELIRLKASKRLYSSIAVEDVRQETFARVFRGIAEDRIAQPERLGAFVNAVCTNVLREQYRSTCREVPTPDRPEDAIPDPAMEAPDRLAQVQMQQEIRQILAGLSKRDHLLMKALFLDERDKDEVCRDFGVTRQHLRVLVHRAKQSFKVRYLKAREKEKQQAASPRNIPLRPSRGTHGNEAFPLSRTLTLTANTEQGGTAGTWF
jgi:RNA polymerase sigma-70 factor, ECF subfamily